jgi:hypothetical protein
MASNQPKKTFPDKSWNCFLCQSWMISQVCSNQGEVRELGFRWHSKLDVPNFQQPSSLQLHHAKEGSQSKCLKCDPMEDGLTNDPRELGEFGFSLGIANLKMQFRWSSKLDAPKRQQLSSPQLNSAKEGNRSKCLKCDPVEALTCDLSTWRT